ncbi:putative acidic endochitinase-like, partial [Capsicum annuum]
MGLFHHEGKPHRNGGDYVYCILSNEFEKNLNLEVTLMDTDKDSKCMRVSSNCSFLSLVEKDDLDNAELKLELDTIESQYQQCFQELARMKLEAIDACRKRSTAKKNLAESPRSSYNTHDDAEEELKFIAYLKRFLKEEQNFNLDVHPISESVCADEIFSDGYIMPRYLDRSKVESFCETFNNFNTNSSVPSTSTPPTPISKLSNSTTSQADFLEK